MRQRFALVFNERAGSIRPLLLDRVLTLLRNAGASVVPVVAASAHDATEKVRALAISRSVEAVIAAGGDGTIRAVATGVAGTGVPVGIVPLGTGNVMKYEIGLKASAKDIAATLLQGAEVSARGGLVNGAPFFLMAGAGFDGRIVAGLDHKTKRVVGRAAYTVPVTRALLARPERFSVDADGTLYEASWVIVTCAAHYGGSFVLTAHTQLGYDRLIAIIVTGATRRALIGAGVALAMGRLGDPARCPAGVVVRPVQRVRIFGGTTPVQLEVDGDEAGALPADITADGPQVGFIVPSAYVAEVTKRHTNRVT